MCVIKYEMHPTPKKNTLYRASCCPFKRFSNVSWAFAEGSTSLLKKCPTFRPSPTPLVPFQPIKSCCHVCLPVSGQSHLSSELSTVHRYRPTGPGRVPLSPSPGFLAFPISTAGIPCSAESGELVPHSLGFIYTCACNALFPSWWNVQCFVIARARWNWRIGGLVVKKRRTRF